MVHPHWQPNLLFPSHLFDLDPAKENQQINQPRHLPKMFSQNLRLMPRQCSCQRRLSSRSYYRGYYEFSGNGRLEEMLQLSGIGRA